MSYNNGLGADRLNELLFEPTTNLKRLAKGAAVDILSEEFAVFMDEQDELKHLRKDFCYPKNKELPRSSSKFLDVILWFVLKSLLVGVTYK